MIETGIPKLDEYLEGIPPGKSLVFSVEPGVEESDVGIHVLHHNLEKGKRGIYVVSESSPKNVVKKFADFNWDVKRYENLTIVDGYSSLVGAPTEEKYVVEEPHDIRSYEDALLEILEKNGGQEGVIVFDSLSNLLDMCGEREALEGIERINKDAGSFGFATIYNFIAWPYKEALLYRIKRTFNSIIEINMVEDVATRQRLTIKKIDWNNNEGKKFDFKIFKPEGIRVYIPKISVIGPYQSGKTTFIKAMARNFTPVERMGATVGVEHATVDYKGYRAEIFGIPGQERFLPLLDKLGASSMGVFLVVDSTKPHEFEYAKRMLERFGEIPFVVVANKQDLPGALRKEEVKARMGVQEDVVESVATTGQGVYEAFERMVEKILEWLNAR